LIALQCSADELERHALRAALALLTLSAAVACSGRPLDEGRDAGGPAAAGGSGHGGAAAESTGSAGAAGSAATAGSTGSAGAAGIAGSEGSVTEWSIPFADSQPFQIAAWGTSVFYLTVSVDQMLGRLDTENDTVTEWPVSDPSTSPGDVQVRPSDGAVFFPSATVGELRQFDPQTQLLRRWSLPLDVPPGDTPGPWSIAFDANDRVIFSAYDAGGPLIGRLDTVSGHLDVWSFPDGGPMRVWVAPDGTIICTTGLHSYDVVRLDPATGVLTEWALVDQPLWGSVIDGSGDIFFTQLSTDFQGLARFSPATGRLTHWATSDLFGYDSLDLLSGHVFFASSSPTALEALDPAVAGKDTILSPMPETVTPRTSVVTPTMAVLSGQQASAQVTRLTAQRQTTGAFSSWSLPGAPRMLATVPGAVYYADGVEQFIARLVVGTLGN
jgi:streptogramin lyase